MDNITKIKNLIFARTPADTFVITFVEGPEGFTALKALVESNCFRFGNPKEEVAIRANLLFAVKEQNWKRVNKYRTVTCILIDVMPRDSEHLVWFMERVAPYIQKLEIGAQSYERLTV